MQEMNLFVVDFDCISNSMLANEIVYRIFSVPDYLLTVGYPPS